MKLVCCGASKQRHPLVDAVASIAPKADSHEVKTSKYLPIVEKFRHHDSFTTEAYDEMRKVTRIWALLMVFSFSAVAVGIKLGNCTEGCPLWVVVVFGFLLLAIGVWQGRKPHAHSEPLHILLGLATLYDFFTDAQSVVQAYHCDAQYQQNFLLTVQESRANFLAPVVERCHLWGLLLVSVLMASALQVVVVFKHFSEARRLAAQASYGIQNLSEVSSHQAYHNAFLMAEFLGFGGMANYFWSGCAPDGKAVASALARMEDECVTIGEDEGDSLSKTELGTALHLALNLETASHPMAGLPGKEQWYKAVPNSMAMTLNEPTIEMDKLSSEVTQPVFGGKHAVTEKWCNVVRAAEVMVKAEERTGTQLFLLKVYAVLLVETIPQFYLQTSLFALTFPLTSSTAKYKQFLSFALGSISLLKEFHSSCKHIGEVGVKTYESWRKLQVEGIRYTSEAGNKVINCLVIVATILSICVLAMPALVILGTLGVCVWRVRMAYVCEDHLWNFSTGCVEVR
eukprot:TRINITY_DN42043_c0_g2_i1.p1 TRINITY_DN42043_c0_g2~~TRINITY_DN42043_c0_g2_i1.p1  ORF type:complete len:512 (-),score=52.07 TRINITY_DN42043_c0_g2_i1:169-1704(-)